MKRDNQRQTRLAYLAGIFDGEGCTSLYQNRRKLDTKYVVSFVKCQMCEPQGVQLLLKEFGGSISYVRHTNKKARNAYHWQLYGRKQVRHCLKTLLPYLVIKKQIAFKVIQWCDLMDGYAGSRRLPEDVLKRREELYHDVKKLIRPVAAETKSWGPERVCDSPNPEAIQGELVEAPTPPSELFH